MKQPLDWYDFFHVLQMATQLTRLKTNSHQFIIKTLWKGRWESLHAQCFFMQGNRWRWHPTSVLTQNTISPDRNNPLTHFTYKTVFDDQYRRIVLTRRLIPRDQHITGALLCLIDAKMMSYTKGRNGTNNTNIYDTLSITWPGSDHLLLWFFYSSVHNFSQDCYSEGDRCRTVT